MTAEARPRHSSVPSNAGSPRSRRQQHALAVEKARLLEQLTPLRLGVVAPNTALVQLKAKGVTLRGLTTTRSAARRPRPAILHAVASIRPAAVPLAR